MWTLRSYESQDSGVVGDHLDMPEHDEASTILETEEESPKDEVRNKHSPNFVCKTK